MLINIRAKYHGLDHITDEDDTTERMTVKLIVHGGTRYGIVRYTAYSHLTS